MPRPPDLVAGAALCHRAQALLDRRGDGDLSAAEEAFLAAHLSACAACASEAALADELAATFAALPRPSCPPALSRAVLAVAEGEAAGARVLAWRPPATERVVESGRRSEAPVATLWRRAAPAAAAALLAVVAGGLTYQLAAPRTSGRPSAAEVARAERELELTLAYLGRVGREAGAVVREEVVENVVAPAQELLGHATLR